MRFLPRPIPVPETLGHGLLGVVNLDLVNALLGGALSCLSACFGGILQPSLNQTIENGNGARLLGGSCHDAGSRRNGSRGQIVQTESLGEDG